LFLILSVGCYECHKQSFWFMLMDFLDAAKHHDIRNFASSQVIMNLEICIVSSASHDTSHIVVPSNSEQYC
jgi:hypothetical protein